MKTTITARHCEISDALKSRAGVLIERVSKRAKRPQRAQVTFDSDNRRKLVEVILHLPRGQTRVASAEGDDFLTVLERAVAKLKHQVARDGTDITRRRGKTPA